MKGIVIFYNDDSCKYADEKVFGGLSSRNLCENWAKQTEKDFFTINSSSVATLTDLLTSLKEISTKESADYVIFSYNDLPFLNCKLTEKLVNTHIDFKSEYTFADGYPYGFAPELIDCGTLGILLELSKTNQKKLGDGKISRDSIYNLLKSDINSFEVEAELADEDWRLYRFTFDCGKKEHFMQCKALYEACNDWKKYSADELSKIASETMGCLKTVPGFYNIQISDKTLSNYTYLPYESAYTEKYKLSPMKASSFMNYERFSNLVERIAQFSESAVISLSAWGEPLSNPDCLKMIEKVLSYKGLSVFVETDGLLITDDFCTKLGEIVNNADERNNGWQKVMFAVSLDAFTENTYLKLHKGAETGSFNKAVAAVEKLQTVISGSVYPQFVRINENEEELEGFYRYWNEKTNASGGNLIIQKYDDFAGLLPPCKPADLSPLDRNPCWHTRRDMTILSNGDVPSCRTYLLGGVVGNVFSESLEEIWHKTDDVLRNHIEKKYLNKCEKCDESYTYNF